jgi:phage terminase small subunit
MSKNNGNHKKPDARKISKKLTLKQRRFVSEFTNPEGEGFGNQTRAAELAGYSQLAPAQAGHRLMRNGEIEGEVERIASSELNHILDAAGVTVKRLAKRLRQSLDAKETKAFIHQKTGDIVYSKPMKVHDIRLKAIRLAAELRGDMAPKEINVSITLLAERLQAARRREYERTPQPSERTVQGVRVEPEADNLGGAPQAEEKTKEVELSE